MRSGTKQIALVIVFLLGLFFAAPAISQEGGGDPASEPKEKHDATTEVSAVETHGDSAKTAPGNAHAEEGTVAGDHGSFISLAQPNRPSISDSPEVLPFGLMQVEYGWTSSRVDADHTHNTLGSMFRAGVAPNLELRWGWDHFVREDDSVTTHTGGGDTTAGLQYQFLHAGKSRPALAAGYSIKFPTANAALGSGEIDHALSFLAGKHFGRTMVDVNLIHRLVGRELVSGFDSNNLLIITFAHPLGQRVDLIGEVLGESKLNASHESFAPHSGRFLSRCPPGL